MDDHTVPVLPEAEGLMRLTTGLWASQTLAAAEQLGLCTFLSAQRGATVTEVAAGLDIKERPAEILLTACAALGLLSREGIRFVNTAMAEAYLVRGGRYYLGDYVRMLTEYVYPGWMRVTDAIRADAPARVITHEQQGIFEAGTRPKVFWDGLYPLSALTARALAEVVDLSDARSLLDVGGGAGAFAVELCQRYPELRVTLFDLAFVCEHSAEKVEQLGLAGRIGVHPGDFFAEPELPGGHDVILLSMILHDWDEPRNTQLLAKCFQALPSGGRLVISELLVDDEKTGPLDAALMSMNMLVGTWGRNYTVAEYSEWLRKAGFERLSTVRFTAPGANGAVIAVKP